MRSTLPKTRGPQWHTVAMSRDVRASLWVKSLRVTSPPLRGHASAWLVLAQGARLSTAVVAKVVYVWCIAMVGLLSRLGSTSGVGVLR